MRLLNFSGAPALIVPRAALRAWHGILVRDDTRDDEPDFEDEDGGAWFVHDAFDFDHPVTHYDHLCASLRDGPVRRVVRVGEHDALAINTGDDAYGWVPERVAVLTNESRVPEGAAWWSAQWACCAEITFAGGDLVLMNASVHGAQILSGDEASEHEPMVLPAGRFAVETATVGEATAFRFVVREPPAGASPAFEP